MIQPLEILTFLKLDTALDDLTTYQHCFLEFAVGTGTFLFVGSLFALADFGFCWPKWLKKVQDDVTPPTDEYINILSVAFRNIAGNFLLSPFYAF